MTDADLALRRRDLKITRLYYFLLSGTGFISPYLNIFYTRLGLSGAEIGLVKAVGSIIILGAAPLWANTSEKWRHPGRMLQFALFGSSLAYLWLGQQRQFLGIALSTALLALLSAGISPLSDALAITVTRATRKGFGSVRILASMGWIVFVLSGGWLNDRLGLFAGFVGVATTFLLGAAVIFPIAVESFSGQRSVKKQHTPINRLIKQLLHNRGMIGIGLMMTVTGLANSGVAQFENVYLDQLGASEGLIGMAGIMSALVEIPCMLWADRLLNRHSAFRLLLIAMVMNSAVRGIVLLAPSIGMIMVMRAVGGVAFSFYTIALIRFFSDQTLPQETRTVLALYNVTLANVINIVGAPIAGAAYDLLGARPMYAVAVAGYLIGWGCLYITRQRHAGEAKPAI